MVDETIRYNVEIDTAQLSEQLMRARQQIDNAISSTGGTAGGMGGASSLAAEGIQNQGLMDKLIDRSENYGTRMLDQVKADNFMLRDMGSMPSSFSSRSSLENVLGGSLAYGYDPSSSPYSMREYMQMSVRNPNIRIPIFGTEAHGNRGMANFFQDVSLASVGGKLSDYESLNLAKTVRNLDLESTFADQGFDRAEISSVVKTMAGQGDFITAQSVGEYTEKITATLSSLRSVMHSFRITGEEAIQMQGTLRNLGIDSNDVGDASINLAARGSVAGLSARDMLVAAQTGGQIAANMGVNPINAMGSYGDLLTDLRRGGATGDIDKWRINSFGGEAGTMQVLATESAKFWATGPGMLALGGGTGPTGLSDMLQRQLTGNLLSATNPNMGVLAANDQASNLFRSIEGRDPNIFEAAQLTETMFGTPQNASIIAVQRAKSGNTSEALDDQLKILGSTITRQQNELPALGLVNLPGNIFDFYKKQARIVGSSIGLTSSWLTEEMRGYSTTLLDVGGDNTLSPAEFEIAFSDSARMTEAGNYMKARKAAMFFEGIGDSDYDDSGQLMGESRLEAADYLNFLGIGSRKAGIITKRNIHSAQTAAHNYSRPSDDVAIAAASTIQTLGFDPSTVGGREAFIREAGTLGIKEKLKALMPGSTDAQLDEYTASLTNKLLQLGVEGAQTTSGGDIVDILRSSVKIDSVLENFAAVGSRIQQEAKYVGRITGMDDTEYAAYISSGAALGEMAVEMLRVLKSRPGAEGLPVYMTGKAKAIDE